MRRQRSLQKGKSGWVLFTDFWQMGQRSLTAGLRGIRFVFLDIRIDESESQREDRYKILATRS